MYFVYNLLTNLIFLLSPVILFFRILKGKEDTKRFKEKFCLYNNNNSLKTLVENLQYAVSQLNDTNTGLVIEPKNQKDFPGYFLTNVEQAKEICQLVGNKKVKIMFDFYHVQISQGNVLTRFKDNFNFIGHVQMASVPERNEPIFGELNYSNILSEIYKFGYQGFVGAEYNPLTNTDDGLSWMKEINREDK